MSPPTATTLGPLVLLLCACTLRGAVADEGAATGAAAFAPDARTTIVVLGAQARFPSDEADLSARDARALRRLIERLPDHGELVSIRVVGHTDSLGPADYNVELSRRRARLIGAAIAERHPGVPLVSVGAGESMPVASNATASGRALNRRVEIHVVAKEGDADGRRATPGTAAPAPAEER